VAQANSRQVPISAEDDDVQVWPHKLHSGCYGYASAMSDMYGVRFEVGGWNPRGAADAAAEDELTEVFVAEFVDGSEEAVHDSCVAAAWAEGKS